MKKNFLRFFCTDSFGIRHSEALEPHLAKLHFILLIFLNGILCLGRDSTESESYGNLCAIMDEQIGKRQLFSKWLEREDSCDLFMNLSN